MAGAKAHLFCSGERDELATREVHRNWPGEDVPRRARKFEVVKTWARQAYSMHGAGVQCMRHAVHKEFVCSHVHCMYQSTVHVYMYVSACACTCVCMVMCL